MKNYELIIQLLKEDLSKEVKVNGMPVTGVEVCGDSVYLELHEVEEVSSFDQDKVEKLKKILEIL